MGVYVSQSDVDTIRNGCRGMVPQYNIMEKVEDTIIWILGGVFSITAAVVGYLYDRVIKRIGHIEEKIDITENRISDTEKAEILMDGKIDRLEEKLTGDIKRMESKMDSNQKEILIRLDHISKQTR